MDPFWYDNINILYNKYRIFNFIPTKDQSFTQKLNAIARLFIYFSLILVIVKQDINYIIIAMNILKILQGDLQKIQKIQRLNLK